MNEVKENKEETNKPKKIKIGKWKLLTVIFATLLVIAIFTKGFSFISITGMSITGMSAKDAADKAVNFMNENLLQGQTATLVSVKEENKLYKIEIMVAGKSYESYVTKDGEILFTSGINMAEIEKQLENTENTEPTATEVPKTKTPKVELFVMSFCPYGLEGEKLLKPVFDLLKGNVDFKVRFFATPQGDSIEEVRSLHGNLEAQEDARQVCINKYYSDAIFWNYLYEIANTCPTAYKSDSELDACWKTSAKKVGIDIPKIENCYNNEVEMILNRFEEDGGLVSKYGLSGSESIVINGVKISPAQYRWSPDKAKDLICSAFENPPEECSTLLEEGSAGNVQGSC